tara:strand:- start:692 stop:898 length:207 start_codon:yes stop_codon:yes gene_type:complete
METLIIGLAINLYTWSNADFFVQKKNNERQYTCVWVDKGWSEADPNNPSVTIFGYTKYKQQCVTKEKE